jgi:hypothetical protein
VAQMVSQRNSGKTFKALNIFFRILRYNILLSVLIDFIVNIVSIFKL